MRLDPATLRPGIGVIVMVEAARNAETVLICGSAFRNKLERNRSSIFLPSI
jgi:hypothetical protein